MKRQGQVILGGVLILIGGLVLLGNLLNISLWAYFWPLFFIALGVWVIARPSMIPEGMLFSQRIIGDISRKGDVQVDDEEMFVFIGDVNLDLREAVWPEGETKLRILGFVADVRIRLPENIPASANVTALVSDVNWGGQKQDRILTPYAAHSDGYETARSRLRIEMVYFVADLKVQWE